MRLLPEIQGLQSTEVLLHSEATHLHPEVVDLQVREAAVGHLPLLPDELHLDKMVMENK